MGNNGYSDASVAFTAEDVPPELTTLMIEAATPVKDIRQPISLKELHYQLEADYEVSITYDALSTLIGYGNIAEQLQIGGTKARREIPPDVVPILAEFLPAYKKGRGRLPQAPDLLEGFLRARIQKPAIFIPKTEEGKVNPAALAFLSGWSQGRAQGLAVSDAVMNAREAAEFLGVSTSMLRKTVKPFRRFGNAASGDRWRRSDLLSSAEEMTVRDAAAKGIADAAGVLAAPQERKALPPPPAD